MCQISLSQIRFHMYSVLNEINVDVVCFGHVRDWFNQLVFMNHATVVIVGRW